MIYDASIPDAVFGLHQESVQEVVFRDEDQILRVAQLGLQNIHVSFGPNLISGMLGREVTQDGKVCIEGRSLPWFILMKGLLEDKLKEFSRQYSLESYAEECREKFAAELQIPKGSDYMRYQSPIAVRFEGENGKTKTEIFALYLLLLRMAVNFKKQAISHSWELKGYPCPLLAVYEVEKSLQFEVMGKELLIQEMLVLNTILEICLKNTEYSNSLDKFYWNGFLPNMRTILLNLEGEMEKPLQFEVMGKELLIQEVFVLNNILEICLKNPENTKYSNSLDEFYWNVFLPNMRAILLNLEAELDQKNFETLMKKVTPYIFSPDTLSKLSQHFDEKPLLSSVLLPLLANYIDLSNLEEGFNVFYNKLDLLERAEKWVELHCEAVKYVPPEKGRKILDDATNYVNEKMDSEKVGTVQTLHYVWDPKQKDRWDIAKITALSLIRRTSNSLQEELTHPRKKCDSRGKSTKRPQ
ncbi:MAG: hypothetical protein AAF443_06810 [Chlamydiota bacterium]